MKQNSPLSTQFTTQLNKPLTKKLAKQSLLKVAPWLLGGSMALSHIHTAGQCTLTQQGRCSTCGSCVIALGTLVAWALLKQSNHDPK